MPKILCNNPDCTIAETGKCLIGKTAEDCEHVKTAASPAETTKDSDITSGGRKFYSGREVGTEDAHTIMRNRYAHLIAILGPSDAGKTCLLSSLYLLACHGGLSSRYLFAGSLSLQGYEDRARKLRSWSEGHLPEKLADHTHSQDSRQPSLLHLALQDTALDDRRLELLFTDLPGEWTATLIDRASSASRFAFLHRADGIVIVIDGPRLTAPDEEHLEVHRNKLLLSRLSETVKVDTSLPLVMFVSKADKLGMSRPSAVDAIEGYAKTLGFSPHVILGASFSSDPENIPNGAGILETLECVTSAFETIAQPPPPASSDNRLFLQFRC